MNKTSEVLTAKAQLNISGRRVQLEMSVPKGPTTPRRMLPLYRSVAGSLIDTVVEAAAAEGLSVSCKKGCGACCRQLVPISEVEAHHLSKLVSDMPEPRRSKVRARFESTRQQMQEAGLLEKLLEPESITDEEFRPLGLEYFAQGVACPFLEDESCSIHKERPIVCREYLAVSPPENCATLTAGSVKCLNMPAKVSNAIRGIGKDGGEPSWVPLILALDWAAQNHQDEHLRSGKELVAELFNRLTGKDVDKVAAS
jgi:Fe-S-cluster containining protein